MKQTFLFLCTIFCLLHFGCSESAQDKTDSNENNGMAQFANDKDFQEEHELPKNIDFDGKGEIVHYETPDGQKASAYTIKTTNQSNKYLFVIHEWYGLNDHIKREADRLFNELENVNVMALDIYDGKVADNRKDAAKFMSAVKMERAESIIQGAINFAGEKSVFGTIGWCFGGGWSLRASILAREKGKACVIYYGMPVKTAKELAPLEADILGIFASQEKWINPDVVKAFEALTKATAKNMEVHSFDADHAFANPSSDRYNEAAAMEANRLSLNFLKERL